MSKKAQTIFQNMMEEARESVRFYGRPYCEKENVIVKFDTTGTDHNICKRTINDMTKVYERENNHLHTRYTLGMVDFNGFRDEQQALIIVLMSIKDAELRHC